MIASRGALYQAHLGYPEEGTPYGVWMLMGGHRIACPEGQLVQVEVTNPPFVQSGRLPQMC